MDKVFVSVCGIDPARGVTVIESRRCGVSAAHHRRQKFKYDFLTPFFASVVDNEVDSTDTLNVNSAGAFTGNTGAKSSQRYRSSNTRGQKYSCSRSSENNALMSVSEGCSDKDKDE